MSLFLQVVYALSSFFSRGYKEGVKFFFFVGLHFSLFLFLFLLLFLQLGKEG